MNLKDAFRYQNKLKSLSSEILSFLSMENNYVSHKVVHLRSKVNKDYENEEIVQTFDSEYSSNITALIKLNDYLLSEQVKLAKAIREAKVEAGVDIDSETGLNSNRQLFIKILQKMVDTKATEKYDPMGGYGFAFNNEGNQIRYSCPVKQVKEINFDRNYAKKLLSQLSEKAEKMSDSIDRTIVNAEVKYEIPFNVNSTLSSVFHWFVEEKTN